MDKSKATKAPTTVAVPAEWPPEVVDKYTPIRTLGKGGFASVMLGREKQNPKNMVAIKVVGNANVMELTYAHREVEILQELSAGRQHPNIMQVLNYWEASMDGSGKGNSGGSNLTRCGVLVLSYAQGPTVESLLQYGGALSTVFGRVVAAQAMDAVAYLHYRAVVHRDIKPDNLIVTGAYSKDDEIWDNLETYSGLSRLKNKVASGADALDEESLRDFDAADGEPEWGDLIKRWRVTLIDFGFARALTPKDVKQPSLELRRENLGASFHSSKSKGAEGDRKNSGLSSLDNSNNSVSVGRSRPGRRSVFRMRTSSMDDELAKSFSHTLVRRMSAVGNRNFAAPEIVDKVQKDDGRNGAKAKTASKSSESVQVTETVSEYVADYGVMVDSYSMGFTLKYMMTGVPPYLGIEQAIAEQESLCNKICRGSSKKTTRQPQYRRLSELPGEVRRLIEKLTERSEKDRTSIRRARRSYLWISGVFSGCPEYEESEEQQRGLAEISCLPLALRTEKSELDTIHQGLLEESQ